VTVSSTLTVSGNLVLNPESVLTLEDGSSLSVGGCLQLGGARVVYRVGNDFTANREYEIEIGQQSNDCGDFVSEVDVVSSDTCIAQTTGRLESRSRLMLTFKLIDTCAISLAQDILSGSIVTLVLITCSYLF